MDLCANNHGLRVRIHSSLIATRSTNMNSTTRHSINALSFSHDGEYLAIANAGTYIDIVSFSPSVLRLSLIL